MFTNLLALTWVLKYFLKRENIKTKVRWNRRLRLLCTLCIGVSKKIPFTFYTYVLAKILQNGAKFIQKLTPGFKNHMTNLENIRQALESPKSWNLMGYFCPKINLSKKYIPSAKTLYTEYLTFNYLFENSPNYLRHYITFHDTTPLYLFSSNTT